MKVYRDGLTLEVTDPPRTVVRDGHTCEVFKIKDGDMWFVTLEDTHFCAHGNSFHEAVAAAKEKQSPGAGKAEAIERIQKSGMVNLTDFCLATGACRAGAIAWAKEEAVNIKDEFSVKEVLTMLGKSSWAQTLKEALEVSDGLG